MIGLIRSKMLFGESHGIYSSMRLYDKRPSSNQKILIPLLSNINLSKGTAVPTFSRSTTGTYIDTNGLVQTADINTARFQNGGYLCEPQATNLITYSSDFLNSSWSKSLCVVTANYETSPAGTLTATKLNSKPVVYGGLLRSTYAYSASTAYSLSLYVKKINHRYIGLRMSNFKATGDKYCFFDFDTGIASNANFPSAKLTAESLASGWYRLILSGTTEAVPVSTLDIALTSSDGAVNITYLGTESVSIWEAQLDQALTGTSNIMTSGSPSTRTADVLTYDVSSVLTPGVGSLYCEFNYRYITGFPRVLELSDGTANNNLIVRIHTTKTLGAYIINAGVQQTILSTATALTEGSTHKILVVYALNDFRFYLDGVLVGSSTSYSVPAALTSLAVGMTRLTASQLNGTIKNVKYYNKALTEAQAIKETT